jgi:hypothetical protein
MHASSLSRLVTTTLLTDAEGHFTNLMRDSRDMKMDGLSEQEGCRGPYLINRSYLAASENSTARGLLLAYAPTWLDNQLEDDLV